MVKLDPLSIHSSNLGDTVGSFHGTPVQEWYSSDTHQYEASDSAGITKKSISDFFLNGGTFEEFKAQRARAITLNRGEAL